MRVMNFRVSEYANDNLFIDRYVSNEMFFYFFPRRSNMEMSTRYDTRIVLSLRRTTREGRPMLHEIHNPLKKMFDEYNGRDFTQQRVPLNFARSIQRGYKY